MVTRLEDRCVPAAISGLVFFDTNADGIQNNNESTAPGLAVSCTPAGGSPASATTNSLGWYGFSEVANNSYTVAFTAPTGYSVATITVTSPSGTYTYTPVNGSVLVSVGTDNVNVNAALVENASPPVSPPPPVVPPPVIPPPPPSSSSDLHWISTSSTDWTVPANWSANRVPTNTDNVYFDIPGTVSTTNAGAGLILNSLNSLHVLAGYTQTITMAVPMTIGTLEMSPGTGGKIDQPGTDLTITTALNWTTGTINSTSTVANLILSGATAHIAPANAGTLLTGSTLRMTNGAVATFEDGTVNFTDGDGIDVSEGCAANFEIGTAGNNVLYSGPIPSKGKITLPTGTTGTFSRKAGLEGFAVSGKSDMPIVITGGTFTTGYGVKLTVTGRVGGNDGANVSLQSGTTRLYHDEYLDAGLIVPNGMGVSGGTLTTVNDGSGNNQSATITGNLLVSGGIVTIDEGRQVGHHFGRLDVIGNITWIGGVFRPLVDGTVGSLFCDSWECTGTFSIFASGAVWGSNGSATNAGARLGPSALNNQANLAGRTWDIMSVGDSFQYQQNSPALSFETQQQAAVWQIRVTDPVVWDLKRTAN